MLVMKFGGTSVGSAPAIQRVVEIIRTRETHPRVVVASAVSKTTDELVSLCRAAAAQDKARAEGLVEWVEQKHLKIIDELGLGGSGLAELVARTGEELSRIGDAILERGEAPAEAVDGCMSWGEYLSCNILVACLRQRGLEAEWIDARRLFLTDARFGKARPDPQESRLRVQRLVLPAVEAGKVVVVQGFIGADANGRTTTFGRGGSDYSATFLGSLLRAKSVEIWTDVDGIMTADPSLVANVRRIKRMTFEEAAELAYFGAKVLHPSTLLPAVEHGIPVFVLNSMKPGEPGTEILPLSERSDSGPPVIKSIAYKEGLSVVDIKSTRMLMAYGFLATIFEVFNRYETPVDLVCTSEVSVSVTVDTLEKIEAIVADLSSVAEVGIRHNQAVVSLVGEGVCRRPGLAAEVFGVLEGIQINLISQGASKINISFVIDERNLPEVINRLHRRFFAAELPEEVFA